MTNWPVHNRDEHRDYLTQLFCDLRDKISKLEQQRVRMVSAPVTAIDTIGNTFSVTLPAQEDGTAIPVAGISAPATFLPAIGDTVDLQIIGAVPQYQPGTIAPDVITTTEIAPFTVTRTFRQPNQPTAENVGDVWVDTDDGNKEYIWGPTGAITRQNLAKNPSFEADTAGTVTAITGWTGYRTVVDGATTISNATVTSATAAFVAGDVGASITGTNIPAGTVINSITNGTTVVLSANSTATSSSQTFVIGSVGSITQSISTTGSLVANGTRAAKLVKASMVATNGVAMGWRQSFTAVPGDIFRLQAVITVLIADANKIPELFVEWLNTSGGVIGSGSTTGSGSTSSQQTLVFTSAAMPALTTSIRLTIRRRANGTGSSLTNGDLAADAVLVEKNRVAQTQTDYFDGATPSTTDSKWDDPGNAPNSTSTYWQDSTAGTNQWYPLQFRNGALQPGSIVGSNALAAQTITASLLEALMVLTNFIICGDPAGERVQLDSSGLYAYSIDTLTNTPYISSSLGGHGTDFIGTTDTTGHVVAGLDGTGKVTGQTLAIAGGATIAGTDIVQYIDDKPRGIVSWGTITTLAQTTGRSTEGGDCIYTMNLKGGRLYRVNVGPVQIISTVGTDYGQISLRMTSDGSTPTTSSTPVLYEIGQHNSTISSSALMAFSSDVTVKLLFCHGRNFGSGTITIWGAPVGFVSVEDIGVKSDDIMVDGGVGPGTPVQNYSVYRNPSWWHTFNGSPSLISTGNSLYQGFESFNGNTRTTVGFADVTSVLSGATITWAGVYVYSPHWWYNNGGWPYMGRHGNLADTTTATIGTDFHQDWGTMARGEGRWLQFPTSWWPLLQAGTMRGIAFGPGPSNDQHYYGYYDGPSMQLGINYRK